MKTAYFIRRRLTATPREWVSFQHPVAHEDSWDLFRALNGAEFAATARLSPSTRQCDSRTGVYRELESRDTSSQRCAATLVSLAIRRTLAINPTEQTHPMKLYIAQATCSLAVQTLFNELGLSPELVHCCLTVVISTSLRWVAACSSIPIGPTRSVTGESIS